MKKLFNKQNLTQLSAVIGGYTVDQPDGLNPKISGSQSLGYLVSRFFEFILPIVGILGFLYFLWAGFEFLMSKGEPKGIAAAKARLTYATLGLIIVALAYSVTAYVSYLFGLNTP